MSEEFKVVSDLRPKLREVNLKFKVVSKTDEREVSSRLDGSTHRVSEAIVGDETGVVTMTLWDDQIDQITEDSTFVLKNGYVGFFKNTLRLNIGKYGSIETSEEEIGTVNTENDISSKVYERSYNNRGYGRSNYGSNYGRSSYY
ncbi:MAG: single-stranded DNA-binding protein [Candidatus Odinarchaeota archaeon]|nr:single-stranded DNA-binding protein [Candidatus Odinarchaeota archaeon]